VLGHLKFILFFPKIGPDMYLTHWLLYLKPLRLFFQKRKLGRIGKNSEVRPFSTIIGTRNVFVGDNVIIPPGTTIVALPGREDSKVEIEDDVLIAPNVAIYGVTHTFENCAVPVKNQPLRVGVTRLKKGCWIGINSVILPGITIGRNSVIAANSVVTGDVPDCVVVGGAPAKLIRELKNHE
jgi:acetyltransferase-like isoleucine patch superfamily enzyme